MFLGISESHSRMNGTEAALAIASTVTGENFEPQTKRQRMESHDHGEEQLMNFTQTLMSPTSIENIELGKK